MYRIFRVLFICVISFFLAIPISYFFQSDLYSFMGFESYIKSFPDSIYAAAEFGSFGIFVKTLIFTLAIIIVILFLFSLKKNEKYKTI